MKKSNYILLFITLFIANLIKAQEANKSTFSLNTPNKVEYSSVENNSVSNKETKYRNDYYPIKTTQIGTQVFDANYKFDSLKTPLVEQADIVRNAGFDIFKFGIGQRAFKSHQSFNPLEKSWYDLPSLSNYNNLSDIIENEPSIKHVLNLDFKVFCIWTYPLSGASFESNGSRSYDEIYNLTKKLLETYNNSGKVFMLGHWEGDWSLIPNYNGSTKKITGTKKKAYLKWIKNRQAAIEAARKDTPHKNVWVAHYVEVNRVSDYVDFGYERITNSVLPKVTIDAVSYSVYDAGIVNLKRNLQVIEDHSNFTKYLDGIMNKKVFIGEFGFSLRNQEGKIIRTPEKQRDLTMTILNQAKDWGVPLAYYWQLYNNETCANGEDAGWWLIDNNNIKQPVYYQLIEFLNKK